MRTETIVVGEFESNCFVIAGADSQALVVDPGCNADRILDCLRRQCLTACVYLLTHGHVDHVSATAALCDAMPAPIAGHPSDLEWAFSEDNVFEPFYPAPAKPSGSLRRLADGQEWTDAGLTYRVIETPGHSPGSVCFLFPKEGCIFTGDTLFAGSAGRSDLEGGSPRLLAASLRKLAALPDETRVYAGHGPDTTIAREKRANFYLRNLDAGERS